MAERDLTNFMIDEVESKWFDKLEEVLQCPVCLEIPQQSVIQCMNGHHICSQCRFELHECPLCKSSLTAIRSYTVLQLCDTLKTLKKSFNVFRDWSNTASVSQVNSSTQTEQGLSVRCSSSTQTEQPNGLVSVQKLGKKEQSIKPRTVPLPPLRIAIGTYPCRIGSCTINLPYEKMIGHIMHYHKNQFYEFNDNNGTFTKRWILDYVESRDHDLVFYITDMGLFFLKITIQDQGNLIGVLQIVNCTDASSHFTYRIQLGNNGFGRLQKEAFTRGYAGRVTSCRTDPLSLTDRLFVKQQFMQQITQNKGSFACTLSIRRKVQVNKLNDQTREP